VLSGEQRAETVPAGCLGFPAHGIHPYTHQFRGWLPHCRKPWSPDPARRSGRPLSGLLFSRIIVSVTRPARGLAGAGTFLLTDSPPRRCLACRRGYDCIGNCSAWFGGARAGVFMRLLGASLRTLKTVDLLTMLCQLGCMILAACGVGEKAVEQLANSVVKPSFFAFQSTNAQPRNDTVRKR